jgi:leucyl/phenylalanyl-tRNA---protein transferase
MTEIAYSNDGELIEFLDPALSPLEGIVAVGGRLTTTNLLRAYRKGIFPWPVNEEILPWCCPEVRAILDFKDLHVSRRLARVQRQSSFTFTIDKAFADVIGCCATVKRKDQSGTWITPQIFDAYCRLHDEGHAHSVEVWKDKTLVGGLYGVDSGGAFAGESMFTLVSDASKLALLYLLDHLKSRGLTWIDIQMMTPHMAALGAREIDRDEFLKLLAAAQERSLKLF